MKKLIIILLLFASGLYAQEETLLGTGKIEHGGFGGPVIKFTQIKDHLGVLVGGRGGWIINHTFVIGGGGYGLVNEISGTEGFWGEDMLLNFGYGGFEMEYIMQSDNVVHASFYLLIGGGGVSHRNGWDEDSGFWDGWNIDEDVYDKPDVFFVLEPAVNVELNIVSFFRINAGVGYRYVDGITKNNLTNSDFSGPSGSLTLKFGLF